MAVLRLGVLLKREGRIPLRWYFPLLEPYCLLVGHDVHTVPAMPTEDFVGIYCLRCGACWNLADEVPPSK